MIKSFKFICSLIALCASFHLSYAQLAITSESWDRRNISESGSFQNVAVQNAYEVLSINVDATIKDQIAEVTVTQTIYNPGNRALEVEIFFPLPNGGIVQNFMMMVNGKEIPGQLMKQEEARGIYEEIVRRKRDPALMEYAGYGLFKTSVFPIQIGEERNITVRYTQICDRNMNAINFVYPFGTQKFSAKALRSVTLNARIESSEGLKSIFSPTDDIVIKRSGNNSATVKMEKHYILPTSDFKMVYTSDQGVVGVSLLSYKEKADEPGYFMLLASPAVEETVKQTKKNIIFVLDRSGSMMGHKIEQSKKAIEFVLKNLNDGDLFNIIAYDDRIEKFKPEMQRYTKSTYEEAYTYINGIGPGGGTNINSALTSCMEMLTDQINPNYVLFLTDGLPTAGITDEITIAKNCAEKNKVKARVFAFGVGNDVNARLLDRLSSANGGLSEYVRPGEDIEASVAKIYSNISSPIFTDISIKFDNMDARSTYPEIIPDLFRGGQIIWVGKFTKPGKTNVTISGKNNGVTRTFTFPVEFVSHTGTKNNDYVEKIWASRRVGHLINQIDLNGRNQELVDELVRLSKQYGILTPYTAFLAREDVDLTEVSEIQLRTNKELDNLNKVSGSVANEQRSYKKDLQTNTNVNAPMSVGPDNNNDMANVKNVGNKTFYNKNNTWVDSEADAKSKQNVIKVKMYSDEYFKLAKGQSAEFNQYISIGENVVLVMNGQTYEFVK